jgi:dimethylhistidine N-methyltransferase
MALERLDLVAEDPAARREEFARDVRQGLTAPAKRLACRFFYDAEGSRLFEEICALPEYYLTRAEREILAARAGEIAALFPGPVSMPELGSGSAVKTRLLIEAFLARHGRLRYVPVDISPTILEESARALLEQFPQLEIHALAAEYAAGLAYLRKEADRPKLVLWLGSNIGNLGRADAHAFLSAARNCLSAQDRLLVGIDLRKDRETLERAYDDSQGVTARFNLNLLARINRELGGRFDLDAFRHRARYDEELGRVEIYLDSRRDQAVRIDALDLTVSFAAGESIHTEYSYKYSPGEISRLAAAAGLRVERQWFDAAGRFSLNLLGPVSGEW